MKKLKLITAIVAALVISNMITAANPTPKDFTINLANNMLKSISRDIMLTDSQKISLQTSANEYEVKMKDLKKQVNSDSKKTKNNDAVLNYRAKLNQILTKEQLDTLQIKRIQRSMTKTTNNNQN